MTPISFRLMSFVLGSNRRHVMSQTTMALWTALTLCWVGWGSPAAAQVTVTSLVDQVSQANYQHYLDDLLFTHDGDRRGPERTAHDVAMTNILQELTQFGLQTELEPFEFEEATYYNVVSVLPGKTARSNEVYIISAHYDSVDNPGADDDASGVAALLEAARVLATNSFEATVVFAAFDQEETGLYGSQAYLNAHRASNIRGMISLDMIAHNSSNVVEICGTTNSMPLILALSNAVAIYGHGLKPSYGGPEENADNYTFESSGIQACLLFEGGTNLYYHLPQDSVDNPGYIDYAYATRMTQATVGFVGLQAGLLSLENPSTSSPACLTALERQPNGQVRFKVAGEAGKRYLVQASTDLAHWVDLGSYTASAEPFQVTDANASVSSARFYRTREE